MANPEDMKFYCFIGSAEPVGPKAAHRYKGRPRKMLDLREAAEVSGWPPTALVALFNAVYPPGPEEDRQHDWADPWAEAIFDPAVLERLAFWRARIGDMPPANFLRCVLDDFDRLMGECQGSSMLRALGIDVDALADNACLHHRQSARAAAAGKDGAQ